MHWCSPHVFDRRGNKRKSKAECLWWSVAYASGYTLNPAVARYSSGKSVVIDNPSAASSPSLSAHLCSPSVTLLFSPTASCNAALKQRCQVYKYNKVAGGETRKRSNDDTIYVYWFCFGEDHGPVWVTAPCVFSSWGLRVGTCMQIYMHDDEFGCSSQLTWSVFLNQSAHLEALLLRFQMQAGAWGVKMQSRLTLGAVFFFFFLQLMVVMELFFMTTADFGVCGSPVCSPEAVVWLLGLGSNGFCDTVPVVVV